MNERSLAAPGDALALVTRAGAVLGGVAPVDDTHPAVVAQ
jgi:hypothetical protein